MRPLSRSVGPADGRSARRRHTPKPQGHDHADAHPRALAPRGSGGTAAGRGVGVSVSTGRGLRPARTLDRRAPVTATGGRRRPPGSRPMARRRTRGPAGRRAPDAPGARPRGRPAIEQRDEPARARLVVGAEVAGAARGVEAGTGVAGRHVLVGDRPEPLGGTPAKPAADLIRPELEVGRHLGRKGPRGSPRDRAAARRRPGPRRGRRRTPPRRTRGAPRPG